MSLLPIRWEMLTIANDTAKLITAVNKKSLKLRSPKCLSATIKNVKWRIYTRSLTFRSVLIDVVEYFTWTFRPIIRRKNAGVQPNIVISLCIGGIKFLRINSASMNESANAPTVNITADDSLMLRNFLSHNCPHFFLHFSCMHPIVQSSSQSTHISQQFKSQ